MADREYKDRYESYVLFKDHKKQKWESESSPLDCVISSSQPVVMCLCCFSAFTFSAASIIGFWFYFECASVKSRREHKNEHWTSPTLLYLHSCFPSLLNMFSTCWKALCHPETSVQFNSINLARIFFLYQGSVFFPPSCWRSFFCGFDDLAFSLFFKRNLNFCL